MLLSMLGKTLGNSLTCSGVIIFLTVSQLLLVISFVFITGEVKDAEISEHGNTDTQSAGTIEDSKTIVLSDLKLLKKSHLQLLQKI